jgi:3',5'-cyclic AMP phosphodiesterase CpdA
VAAIPGNHDLRPAFAAAFADGRHRAGSGGFLHFTVDDLPLRLLFLVTLAGPGESHGVLCPDRLAWIADRLAEAPQRETLIFMHHPPFATGIELMDDLRCANGDRLAELVAAHGRVLRVACGHVHRAALTGFAGTIGSICPGVAYQLPLRFGPGGSFDMLPAPPAFQLHRWSAATGLVTHTEHAREAP